MKEKKTDLEGDIPWDELAAPARRALSGAGLFWLADLAKVSEARVKQLHGIGPNALKTLSIALEGRGLSFVKLEK